MTIVVVLLVFFSCVLGSSLFLLFAVAAVAVVIVVAMTLVSAFFSLFLFPRLFSGGLVELSLSSPHFHVQITCRVSI